MLPLARGKCPLQLLHPAWCTCWLALLLMPLHVRFHTRCDHIYVVQRSNKCDRLSVHVAVGEGDWWWNKREFTMTPPPRHLLEPSSHVDNELAHVLTRLMNEATSSIPCWEEYSARAGLHGRRRGTAACDEVIPESVYPKQQYGSIAPEL